MIKILILAQAVTFTSLISSCKQAAYEVLEPVKGTNDAQVPNHGDQIINSENGFIFGTTAVFHLGNNAFDGSTCQTKLRALPLNGKTFNFRFEVTDQIRRGENNHKVF